MNEVYIAIVLQIGTLLGLLITALVGRRKVEEVHKLVNGRSQAQEELIRDLRAVLLAKPKRGRPRKQLTRRTDPPAEMEVTQKGIDVDAIHSDRLAPYGR